jgi:hypothetical protein
VGAGASPPAPVPPPPPAGALTVIERVVTRVRPVVSVSVSVTV